VTFVQADLFTWRPDRRFDAAVFCFWLSHIPRKRLDEFLAMVTGALRPGGRLFFADSKREGTSTASNHILPPVGEEVVTRRLNDGTAYRVVKNFRSPRELEEGCLSGGLSVSVYETPNYFIHGLGERARMPGIHRV